MPPEHLSSYDESVTMSGTLGHIMKVKGLSTHTKEMKPTQKAEETRSNLISQQKKSHLLEVDGKPKTRENKENLTGISKDPKRNNLMGTGEHSRANHRNNEISKAQKIISNNHGSFNDEESIRTYIPKPSSKEESSPIRNSIREDRRSTSKKHKREPSAEIEEEKIPEKNNRLSTSKGREIKKPAEKSRIATSPGKKPSINQKNLNSLQVPTPGSTLLNERSPNSRKGPSVPSTSHSRPQSNNPWANNDLFIKANKLVKPSGRYDSPTQSTEQDMPNSAKKMATPDKKPQSKPSSKFSTPDRPTKISSNPSSNKKKTPNMALKKTPSATVEQRNHFEDVDRFSSLSKSPDRRHRRDIGDELENIGEWERSEIESIQEDLEFEINSNASGLHQNPNHTDNTEPSSRIRTTNPTSTTQNKSNLNSNVSSSAQIMTTKKSVTEVQELLEKNNKHYKIQGIKVMEGTIDDFADSLDSGTEVKSTSTIREKAQIEKDITNIQGQMETLVSKVRPYSPPFTASISNDGRSLMGTRGNGETLHEKVEDKGNGEGNGNEDPVILETKKEDDEEELLEVVYDPVWNCYYHPKTNQYFEMK